MTARKDLTGMVFSMFTVIEYVGSSKHKKSLFRCRCECGNESIVVGGNLISGTSTNCGCRKAETSRQLRIKHGLSAHPVYGRYSHMIDRCHNPESDEYKNYGGRGIYVCERWRKSVENFIHDVGMPPSKIHTIDRINNDGPYEPGNCRWATKTEQNINRRTTRWFSFDGKRMCESEWSKSLGMKKNGVSSRLRLGWDIEKALTTPIIAKGKYPRNTDSYKRIAA